MDWILYLLWLYSGDFVVVVVIAVRIALLPKEKFLKSVFWATTCASKRCLFSPGPFTRRSCSLRYVPYCRTVVGAFIIYDLDPHQSRLKGWQWWFRLEVVRRSLSFWEVGKAWTPVSRIRLRLFLMGTKNSPDQKAKARWDPSNSNSKCGPKLATGKRSRLANRLEIIVTWSFYCVSAEPFVSIKNGPETPNGIFLHDFLFFFQGRFRGRLGGEVDRNRWREVKGALRSRKAIMIKVVRANPTWLYSCGKRQRVPRDGSVAAFFFFAKS